MVPLDVLDESWVVELGRVIAAGRQVAARQQKKPQSITEFINFFTIKSLQQAKSRDTVHLQIIQGLNNKY